MKLIVDAQLPPALVAWLRERGHEASHLRDLGLEAQPDKRIVDEALRAEATIITRDADFLRWSSHEPECSVVWIRFGNATRANLLRRLGPVFGEVEAALESGQRLVEVSD